MAGVWPAEGRHTVDPAPVAQRDRLPWVADRHTAERPVGVGNIAIQGIEAQGIVVQGSAVLQVGNYRIGG